MKGVLSDFLAALALAVLQLLALAWLLHPLARVLSAGNVLGPPQGGYP